jgi:hypothetical protein
MKKREVSKKKINHSKKQKKFCNDKLPVILLIASLLVFTFLLGGVNKTTGNAITGNVETDFISSLFAQWSAGQLDVNIAKYLFFFMLAGLIWGALSFAKFPPNTFFQAIIALPVAFLATAYITPAEVFTILQSYTAMGITLTFILPFIIMLFVSAMLLSNERLNQMSVPKILLEFFLWIFFTVILGYKLVEGMVTGKVPIDQGLNFTIIAMLVVFVITILITTFNSRFRKFIWGLGLQIRSLRSETERLEAEEAVKTSERIERARRGRGRNTY